ncbi:MAG: DNA gyrase subunit A [Candidatus Kerfeldbacteria bacterium]|nr:DNA gyrase subunit A [Candidatus Kerfeldbacteria bacterium]
MAPARKQPPAKKPASPAGKQPATPKGESGKKPAPAAKGSAPITPAVSKNVGALVDRPITREMEESYLDYAMSVIVARALPDVRDGLKPVHRRILYAMWNVGLRASAKYRKSATVVGEVLGKYHPHGDVAVYDSMVRMAQPFAMRYPLVDGQGNFGSIDGDGPAAMRYTEAKLERMAEDILVDIEKDTVNFVPNYDGSQKEPLVLPAKLPNFLLNGTVGIAVGMATNVPPHNLSELTDGLVHLIDHPTAEVAALMQFIKGPDFPTGGLIYNQRDIEQAYATGKGSIVMRARAEIEEAKAGGFRIVVSALPYQVNKAQLIEHIANLVRDKKLDGIRDLRDESDKDGIRVVVELHKNAYPKKVLNRLYSLTQLQDSFHVNMLALVDGIQPRVLNLKMVLEEYLKHRKEVVKRRTAFDLNVAKNRAHVLKGLKIALDHLDAVIKTIRASRDRDDAKAKLIKRFTLTEIQANAILDMRLSQLAHLERQKVEDELKEKLALIRELEGILASPKKILGLIRTELTELRQKYGDQRQTEIVPNAVGEFTQEDLIPNEATVVMMTRDGYIKRVAPESFKTQGRGGKGVIGLTTKEEDQVERFFSTTTHADMLFFTQTGKLFTLKAYEIPPASRTAKGQAVVNFLNLPPHEKVSAVLATPDLKGFKFLMMVTVQGVIKKVAIEQFKNIRKSGIIAMRVKSGDQLQWVEPSSGNDEIVLTTERGQAIRFRERDVRPMGRAAAGVRGIRLRKEDAVVGMDIIAAHSDIKQAQLLVVTRHGFGKRTNLSAYKVQGRGGTGILTAEITAKTGPLAVALVVDGALPKHDLVIISQKGQVIRLPLKSVSTLGRATQGVRLMRFSEAGDKVASVTFI